MDNQLERSLHGPGFLEITLGALLSLALGTVLAAVWLVLKPVEAVKEPSADASPSVVYYVAGETNSAGARTWLRKRQVLVEGQSGDLVISEQELNAWASAAIKPPAADATATLVPGQLNFRIHEGALQIASPTTVSVLGISFPIIVQARGTFSPHHGAIVFDPREFFLGSLAVHRIPRINHWLIEKLSRVQSLPDDVVAGWKKVSKATIAGESLTLSLP